MQEIFIFLISYFIGSISPAYILGKLLKNIDIRKVGSHNAGTTNVYKNLGLVPAIITGFYDLGKGLLCMYIAYLLDASLGVIYLAGIYAIIGHIFPFYLGFRGGQGIATCSGILIYLLGNLIISGFVSWESLGFLALIVIVILIITHQKGFLALIVMPILAFLILRNHPFSLTMIYASLIIGYVFLINIYEAYKNQIFKLKPETIKKTIVWRTVLRPLAAILPISYFYLDKQIVLWIIGVLGGIFLVLDLLRLFSSKINFFFFDKIKVIFKAKERKRFSSITLFFASCFITILVFPKSIAIAAIIYLTFGDVFAKFFGMEYGKIKIWNKTLEGSLAHLTICIVAAYLLFPYLGISFFVLIIGAIIATFAEVFPSGINDNFIVAIASATGMLLCNMYI